MQLLQMMPTLPEPIRSGHPKIMQGGVTSHLNISLLHWRCSGCCLHQLLAYFQRLCCPPEGRARIECTTLPKDVRVWLERWCELWGLIVRSDDIDFRNAGISADNLSSSGLL